MTRTRNDVNETSPDASPWLAGDALSRLEHETSRWLASKSHRALASFVFAGLLCLFLSLCSSPLAADDDWSISYYLSGRLPGEGLCLYVNALISIFVYGMNILLPSANWFFVLEHLCTFLAAAALFYGLLTYDRRGPSLAFVGFVSYFLLPYCLAASNYTYVSFLATCAGGFLLVAQAGNAEVGRFERGSAIALLAVGFCWRMQMSLPCLAFVVVAYAWKIWSSRDGRTAGVSPRARLRPYVPLLAALLVCAGLFACDQAVWRADGWRQWREYDAARSITSDYPLPDYDAVAAQLDQMGVSENDYYLIGNWGNADTDVLSTKVLKQVGTLSAAKTVGPTDLLGSIPRYLLLLMGRRVFVIVMAVIVLLLRPRGGRDWVLVMLEVAAALVACSYFLAVGRLLPRVEDPMWGMALAMCIASLGHGTGEQEAGRVGRAQTLLSVLDVSGAVCLVALVALMGRTWSPYFNVSALADTVGQESPSSDGPITSYVKAHPSSHFVFDIDDSELWLSTEFEHRYLLPTDIATRVTWLGGWEAGSPFIRAQCKTMGASNPYLALLTDKDAYLVAKPDQVPHVVQFLREHYDADASVSQVDEFDAGETTVWVWKVA